MIDWSNYPELHHCSTLRETSIDKHDAENLEYMTGCQKKVIDFDKVKDMYISKIGVSEIPKSNDALFLEKSGQIVFVEFKNGFIKRSKQFDIRKKIYDSLLIFSDITSLGIGYLRKNAKYILVYNEERNKDNPDIPNELKENMAQRSESYDRIVKYVRKLGKEEYVLFGLNMFKDYCFKSVHTYSRKEFEMYLKNLE